MNQIMNPTYRRGIETWDEFMEGVWRQNPVFVMVLGMCPTLAVTVSAVNACRWAWPPLFVLVCSCGAGLADAQASRPRKCASRPTS
jgi:Na+-translocating ferredoxin:NAD+ oxidoreductase RnfE subunit